MDPETEHDASESTSESRSKPASRKYWRELIRKNLRMRHKEYIHNGRLDPHSMFTDRKELMRFYSDRLPHPHRLKDNELIAQGIIEEALREDVRENRFQTTGEIMQGKHVTVGVGKKAVPKAVIEAIRADGQKEVDAEDPNGPKDTDCEIVQEVGAVAEDIIAASPNSLGPPIEACARYLYMKKCGEYGRNKLTVWKSPLFPKMDGQNGRRGFLDNQLTAIVWIMSRFLGELPPLRLRDKSKWDPQTKQFIQPPDTEELKRNRERLRSPKYFGGILADSMGLGKTITTIACLDLLLGQGLNVKVEDGKPKYRPILILVPNATVATQWVDEIEQVGSRHSIKKILISGNGARRTREQDRVRILTCKEFVLNWPPSLDYIWDESNKDAARTVFVMSIDAWSRRTCHVRKMKNEHEEDKDEFESFSTFTEQGRKFSVVVVDEAYKVKHAATGYWKSVALLERQFTLLVTATPCMNMLSDLLGPARLLWQSPQKYLQNEQATTWGRIEDDFNGLADLEALDDMLPWDDFQLVAGRPSMLTKLIETGSFRSGNPTDIEQTRKYLKYFESLAILRRAPSSNLYYDWNKARSVCLEGLLPNVDNFTVNIQPNETVEKEYQDVHIDLLIDYMDAIKNWHRKANTKPVISTYRQFQMASASLDVFCLDRLFKLNGFGTSATHVRAMRGCHLNFRHLAPFLLEPGEAEPNLALDYVKLAVRKSPILRYILHYVKENILNRGENQKIKKLLITEASPMLAYYYELVLQFLLIHCRTLHAGLSQEERRDLIASFNNDSDHSCQVMIQMYTVGFAGTNLHKNCSQVLIASQAHSLPVQWQTVHRVIRVGQESDVKVVRLKVNNSFHSFRESRQVEKILPELGTRAQGSMNDILVQLLNLFQFEVDEAWESPEAKKLMLDRNMLLKPDEIPEDEPTGKRIKLDDGTFVETGTASQSSTQPADVSFMPQTTAKRRRDETNRRAVFDCARHFQDESKFLELKTRRGYYDEYKELPVHLKPSFSNAKNNLRRMLTYGGPERNQIKRVWTVEDLDNAAVLERAMELMLRVRLGSNTIEMLPYPQIDFSLASAEKRRKLEQFLGDTEIVDQDIDATQEEANKSKAKHRPEGHDLGGMTKYMSLTERDKVLGESIARGPTAAIKKLEREAKANKKRSSNSSTSELGGSEHSTRREDEEREEVEGDGADHDEEDSSDDNENMSVDAGLNDDAGSDDDASSGDDNEKFRKEKKEEEEEEELSHIDSGIANTALNDQNTDEKEAMSDHGDCHDEEDVKIISSRSIGGGNTELRDIKVKIEEMDAAMLHLNTTNATAEKHDRGLRIKRESSTERIGLASNNSAGIGTTHLPSDGNGGDLPVVRVKQESTERNIITAIHETIVIEDSD
ncbi:hypothetical protein Hte_010409 [Hypoxylon texense]